MNEAALEELAELMAGQVEAINGLIELGRRKTDALVENDIAVLAAITHGEEALAWRLGRLEERRQRLQEFVAAEMAIPTADLTLSRLVAAAAEPFRRRFSDLQATFIACTDQLNARGQVNRELLRQAMDLVDFSLRILGNDGQAPGYSPDGDQRPPAPKSRRLDRRG